MLVPGLFAPAYVGGAPRPNIGTSESAQQRFNEVMNSKLAPLIITFCSEILFHIA